MDHKASPPRARHRVFSGDLDFVVANWKRKDFPDLPGDCVERGCGRESLGAAGKGESELAAKEILQWLAEIWLEPDVRKSIDEEKFLKVYESLKGL